ncbi:MAG: putative lipid II flippase FtsW [Defluviitaleaceae bacterium]|nr:putative lipid II flippase FtsW [Defluviitaleaceae bacterium]MCL2264324.1 putative lipid II flippase FtsW [Defluviitaleaceae bacterium]
MGNRYGGAAQEHDYEEHYLQKKRARKPKKKKEKNPSAKSLQAVDIGNVDITIYLVVTILVLIGVVMVFSASYSMAANRIRFNNDAFYFLRRNGVFALVGFAAMNIISQFNYRHWRRGVWPLYFGTLGLLFLVTVMGRDAQGATRWLEVPIIGGFQPSEVAKVAIIFTIAHLIDKYPDALGKRGQEGWINLAIFCSVVVAVVVLVLMPGGFSSALILSSIGFGMIFIASPYIWRFIIPGILGVGGVALYLFLDAYFGLGFRGARVQAWLDPWAFHDTVGFQTINALYAVATGGWFGIGIGESRQVSFIPEPQHDMIFAIIVEELGLVGAGLILVLFGIFIWRGIIIAMRAPDTFSSMIAIGIVFAFAFQTVINVGVVTNTIPNTGVTLPFISYGGTSLMVSMALAGVLLSISKYTKGADG